MMRRIIIILVFAALGWGGWTYWQRQLVPKGDEYLSVTVDRGDIVKTVSANGTLNPVVLVNVGTQVSGTIKKLHADFNDRVKSGQVLAELDPALFKAAVDQSRANRANTEASLKLAEANAGRTRALYEKGYVARAEWDQAIQAVEAGRAQVAAAAAAVRRDETNLRFSVIVSSVLRHRCVAKCRCRPDRGRQFSRRRSSSPSPKISNACRLTPRWPKPTWVASRSARSPPSLSMPSPVASIRGGCDRFALTRRCYRMS